MITTKELDAITHAGFKSFIKRAAMLDIDVHVYKNHQKLIRLSYKNHTIYTNNYIIPLLRLAGTFTVSKEVTKTVLRENGISVPNGISTTTTKEAISLIKKNDLSYPLITKPLDGSLAKGITWDITSLKDLRKAIHFLKKEQSTNNLLKRDNFIVEEMFKGNEYRVLVLNNKVISCIQKKPATVTGDGTSTIKQLIQKQNKLRRPDFTIKLDTVALKTIKNNNYTLSTVLPKDHDFALRHDMLLSNGGRAIDQTKQMNVQLKKHCIKAVKLLGLTFGGIDLLTHDIKRADNYKIIEVNSNPVYIINEKPLVEGKGVDVSLLLLQEIFPDLKK